MNWELIIKERKGVVVNNYKLYKSELAEEANHQCVYCCIHENRFGGIRNFHVEHYKPKSIFKDLENSYDNLFYACSICNAFKGNDWPNEPTSKYEAPFYPNPSEVNYSDIFTVNFSIGIVEGNNKTARYLINKLFLNRPQLVLERKHFSEMMRFQVLLDELNIKQFFLNNKSKEGNKIAIDLLIQINQIYQDISRLLINQKVRPYANSELKKND